MVWSKSHCPYCRMTKQLLFQLQKEINNNNPNNKLDVHVIELNQLVGPSDGRSIQHYLEQKTGQRTVPNIFISGQHVGGNSDLQDLHSSGKLKHMLMSLSTTSTTSNEEL
jgi:glutaredoxin 3